MVVWYILDRMSKRYLELDLTRKWLSQGAYKVNTEENIVKSLWSVTLLPRLGVLNVKLDQLIDDNKTGLYANSVGSTNGRGQTACRIQTLSNYT